MWYIPYTMIHDILNGVYAGPDVFHDHLNLTGYRETLVSLGGLRKALDKVDLEGCSRLVSLGALTSVSSWVDLRRCYSLISLGALATVGHWMFLEGCTSLVSLGALTTVGGTLYLKGCSSLVSLGSLTTVEGALYLAGCTSLVSLGPLVSVDEGICLNERGGAVPLSDVQKHVAYYSSLPLHEALNALHTDEVQKVPLYKNILLQTLQGG